MISHRDAPTKPPDYDYEKLYPEEVTKRQLRKFLLRRFPDSEISHWHERVKLLMYLLTHVDLKPGAAILDLATSVGTFAIEFAKLGYDVTGVDICPSALETAQMLRDHLLSDGQRIEFVHGDIADPDVFPACSFDCVVAADVFEHLHQDVLDDTLRNCMRWLRPGGYLLFHTYPTKYDYLFHPQTLLQRLAILPLLPCALLKDGHFTRVVGLYHTRVINPIWKRRTGLTWEEHLAPRAHCNLLTRSSLVRSLKEAGFFVLFAKVESCFREDQKGWRYHVFGNKEAAKRSMYGVAWKTLDSRLSRFRSDVHSRVSASR